MKKLDFIEFPMLHFGVKRSARCGNRETFKLLVCQLQNLIRMTFSTSEN